MRTAEKSVNTQSQICDQRTSSTLSPQDEFLSSSDNIKEVDQLVCDLVPYRVYTEIDSRKLYMSTLPHNLTQIELNTMMAAICTEI